jgi:hypothetical protein
MEKSSLSCLDGLSDIGLRGGVDMRPTLIRVLTDLYVQKLTHTPDEERHYTELALRLLEAVDVPTRVAVAARLARHLSPPSRVVQALARDLPEVSAALRPQPAVQMPAAAGAAPQRAAVMPVVAAALDHTFEATIDEPGHAIAAEANATNSTGSDIAGELNELFFAANANERRLILLNLHIVARLSDRRVGVVRHAGVGQHLETAALGRNHEDFIRHLTRSLNISREQAQRIVRDPLGEPIVVAAKALAIPRDVLYRILLFINTAIGHSVERVHALAELYDDLTLQAAEDMVATWQTLHGEQHKAATHQPLLWDDEARRRARPSAATAHRAPATPRKSERRDAS